MMRGCVNFLHLYSTSLDPEKVQNTESSCNTNTNDQCTKSIHGVLGNFCETMDVMHIALGTEA